MTRRCDECGAALCGYEADPRLCDECNGDDPGTSEALYGESLCGGISDD